MVSLSHAGFYGSLAPGLSTIGDRTNMRMIITVPNASGLGQGPRKAAFPVQAGENRDVEKFAVLAAANVSGVTAGIMVEEVCGDAAS